MTQQASSIVRKSLADLAVPADDILRILETGIKAGTIVDDSGSQPAVSLDEFQAALADVKKSVQAMQAKPAAKAAAAAPAEADFFEGDAELREEFKAYKDEQGTRYNNVAKGITALGGLLQQVVTGLARISEQQVATASKTQGELEEVKKSLQVGNKPKSMQAVAEGAGAELTEAAKVHGDKRAQVAKSLAAEKLKLKDGDMAQARRYAQASALFSAWVPPEQVAAALGVTL